jgi:hypothetical protein
LILYKIFPLRKKLHFCFIFVAVCFSVNIVVVSLEREEGDYGSVVLTLAILAKIVSNIGWFIMWVQGIEVRATRARIFKLLRSPRIDSKELILPGCQAWRAGMSTLFQLGS